MFDIVFSFILQKDDEANEYLLEIIRNVYNTFGRNVLHRFWLTWFGKPSKGMSSLQAHKYGKLAMF